MGKKKTEKWVQEQAILFEQKVTNGLVLDSDVLLDDLIDRWFEEYANKRLKPKTVYDYKRMRLRISAGGLGISKCPRSNRRRSWHSTIIWKRRASAGTALTRPHQHCSSCSRTGPVAC